MSKFHRRLAKLDRKKWEKVRLKVLDRDNWRCQKCGKAGRLEVDHKVGLERGGAGLDPANLQALCRNCHFEKSATEYPTAPERTAWEKLVAERLSE